MTIDTLTLALPKPYTRVAVIATSKPRHFDAATCLDHAVFCVRHGFYRVALRYALRSLVRPVFS